MMDPRTEKLKLRKKLKIYIKSTGQYNSLVRLARLPRLYRLVRLVRLVRLAKF